jgi:hypothetical protein
MVQRILRFPNEAACLIFYLVLTIESAYGQSLTRDFCGSIEYSDSFFMAYVKYDSCCDFATKEVWNVDDQQVKISCLDLIDSTWYNYHPFSFQQQGKTIYTVFYYPRNNQIDTIEQFMISIDTSIYGLSDFYIDSSELNHGLSLKEFRYYGDTVFQRFNQKYRCFKFGYSSNLLKSNPGPSYTRQLIYIDQTSLMPIQQEYYCYRMIKTCIPKNQWHMYRQKKIERVLVDGIHK